MQLTTLQHTLTLSIFMCLPSLIAAASTSTDTATTTSLANPKVIIGPRSLQKLACMSLAYNQRFQVYKSWAPVHKKLTGAAVVIALEQIIPADSPKHKEKMDTWRAWVDEGINLMECYRKYVHTMHPYRDDFLECYRLRSLLENDSNDAALRKELVTRFNCIAEQLQLSPKLDQLEKITVMFINGLDASRLTYTTTKLAYEQDLSEQLTKFQKAQSRLEQVLNTLIPLYKNIDIDVTFPPQNPTNVTAISGDKTGPATLQELAIKALVYNQRYHIHSIRRLKYYIDSTNTCAVTRDVLKHMLLAQAQENDPEASVDSITLSPDLHDLVFKDQHRSSYETLAICPGTAAWYHKKFDLVETMLEQPAFDSKALRRVSKKFDDVQHRFKDLPKPKKFATVGYHVINGLDTTFATYAYTKDAYATWLTKQLTALTELIHRFNRIKQRYEELRIDERYHDETRREYAAEQNHQRQHFFGDLEGHHWAIGY